MTRRGSNHRVAFGLLVTAMLAVSRAAWGVPEATLTVQSSKPDYAPGEKPVLSLSLSLAASAPNPVSVCPRATGTIRVLRLTRDGMPIAPRRSVVFFGEDPGVLQERSLQTLAPGQSVAIPYEVLLVRSTPELQEVRVTARPRRPYKVLVYTLPGVGLYTLQLVYDYNGRNGGRTNILRSRVVSNAVSFRLL